MGDQWFYGSQGNQSGPVDRETLRRKIVSGEVRPDDMVWTKGMAQWAQAQVVPELMIAPTPAQEGHDLRPQVYVQFAGFWRRFVAAFIDAIVLSVLIVVIGLAVAIAIGTYFAPQNDMAVRNGWAVTAIAIGWLYFALMESSSHQGTLGKLALSIFVTDDTGEPIGFQKASGRVFAKTISGMLVFVGFVMAAFTRRKQALHDLMVGTLVVRRR